MPLKNSSQRDSEKEHKVVSDKRPVTRNPLIYGFSIIIFVVIVVTFVFTPMFTPLQSNQRRIFGSYAGAEIVFADGNYFFNQYNTLLSQYSSSGNNVQTQYTALKGAFEQTVFHTALTNEARRLGFSVSDDRILKEIRENSPRFQDESGNYDPKLLQQLSQAEIEKITSLLRESLISNLIAKDLQAGARVSDEEKNFIESMGMWQRSFNLLSFTSVDYPDSELVSYAQNHVELFKSMELSSLTVAVKEDAESVRQQMLEKTATFEDLVASYSTDIYKDAKGSRGRVFQKDLVLDLPEAGLADSVFALNQGEISEILSSGSSFVIFRADSSATDPDLNDPATLQTVRDYVSANERGIVEDYLLAKAAEYKTSPGSSLASIAVIVNKTPAKTNFFPINAGSLVYPSIFGNYPIFPSPTTSDGQPIANAADRDQFYEAAFRLKAGEISDPVLLQDQIVLLELAEEKTLTSAELASFITFDQLVQANIAADLQSFMVDQDVLVDNFDSVFFEQIIQ